MIWLDRLLVVLGAVSGVLGVALSAAAAHRAGAGNLDTAARFLLFHAPMLILAAALAATGVVQPTAARAAGFALALGLALFAGDLVSRVFRDAALFPMAAPSGGVMLMLGWSLVALSALLPGRSA